MRRHVRWIIPLVLLLVIYIASKMTLARVLRTPAKTADDQTWNVLVESAVVVAAIALMLICVIIALVQGHKTWHLSRRRKGKLTPQETSAAHAWNAACALVQDAENGVPPQPIDVWGLIPYPGESFAFDVGAGYERFYGTTEEYTTGGGVFLGHPAFVVAGLVGTAIGNNARRNAAARRAATQWREQQQARVLLSNRRLAIHANGQWLSFDFAAASACYPAPEMWSITLEFPGVAPLRLVGEAAPLICVWTVLATQGRDAVAQHPGLDPLRPSSV